MRPSGRNDISHGISKPVATISTIKATRLSAVGVSDGSLVVGEAGEATGEVSVTTAGSLEAARGVAFFTAAVTVAGEVLELDGARVRGWLSSVGVPLDPPQAANTTATGIKRTISRFLQWIGFSMRFPHVVCG